MERAPPDLPALPPIPVGLYRHYKGHEYDVVGVARHSETAEPLVVYRALYGARGLWVRPAAMFTEPVDVDGRPVPRFRYVGPAVAPGDDDRPGIEPTATGP